MAVVTQTLNHFLKRKRVHNAIVSFNEANAIVAADIAIGLNGRQVVMRGK